MTPSTAPQIVAEDSLRAEFYGFLATLLSAPPDATVLAQTAALSGDETGLGRAIAGLATVAGQTTPQAALREYNALFIGVGRGELLPYASYYLTGFLNDKPLARLRGDMASLGIARSDKTSDPEDNIASVLEIMGGLITGRFGGDAGLEAQQTFHAKHIAPWAVRFFEDLTTAQGAVLYAAVGAVGLAFLKIEAEGFRLSV